MIGAWLATMVKIGEKIYNNKQRSFLKEKKKKRHQGKIKPDHKLPAFPHLLKPVNIMVLDRPVI